MESGTWGSEDNYQDGGLFRMNSCYASLRCFYFFGFYVDRKVNVLLITRICFENFSMQLDSITCYMQHKYESVLNCVGNLELENSILHLESKTINFILNVFAYLRISFA